MVLYDVPRSLVILARHARGVILAVHLSMTHPQTTPKFPSRARRGIQAVVIYFRFCSGVFDWLSGGWGQGSLVRATSCHLIGAIVSCRLAIAILLQPKAAGGGARKL